VVLGIKSERVAVEHAHYSWHNQVDMKLAARQLQLSDLVVSDERVLPGLLGVSGTHVILGFRGTRIQVIASENQEGQLARSAAGPVTDAFNLELLSGSGEAVGWHRPVLLQAVIESGSEPVVAVQRASRWASYSARVAVVPQSRLNDRALLEARFRGVWVVGLDELGQLQIAVVGERTSTAGSVRGLSHRLLDELIWEALRKQKGASTVAVRSAATT
jgi:hypothetical protein